MTEPAREAAARPSTLSLMVPAGRLREVAAQTISDIAPILARANATIAPLLTETQLMPPSRPLGLAAVSGEFRHAAAAAGRSWPLPAGDRAGGQDRGSRDRTERASPRRGSLRHAAALARSGTTAACRPGQPGPEPAAPGGGAARARDGDARLLRHAGIPERLA